MWTPSRRWAIVFASRRISLRCNHALHATVTATARRSATSICSRATTISTGTLRATRRSVASQPRSAARSVRRTRSIATAVRSSWAILPEQTIADGGRAMDRVRKAVEGLDILHPASGLGVVTISVGVAELLDAVGSSDDWLRAADAALYRAKENGRNRVELEARPSLDPATASNILELPRCTGTSRTHPPFSPRPARRY